MYEAYIEHDDMNLIRALKLFMRIYRRNLEMKLRSKLYKWRVRSFDKLKGRTNNGSQVKNCSGIEKKPLPNKSNSLIKSKSKAQASLGVSVDNSSYISNSIKEQQFAYSKDFKEAENKLNASLSLIDELSRQAPVSVPYDMKAKNLISNLEYFPKSNYHYDPRFPGLSFKQRQENYKQASSSNNIFNRLYLDALKKQDNIEYNETIKVTKELENCTFAPNKLNK